MAADEDDEDNWSEFTSLDSLEEGDLEEIQVRFDNCLKWSLWDQDKLITFTGW